MSRVLPDSSLRGLRRMSGIKFAVSRTANPAPASAAPPPAQQQRSKIQPSALVSATTGRAPVSKSSSGSTAKQQPQNIAQSQATKPKLPVKSAAGAKGTGANSGSAPMASKLKNKGQTGLSNFFKAGPAPTHVSFYAARKLLLVRVTAVTDIIRGRTSLLPPRNECQ